VIWHIISVYANISLFTNLIKKLPYKVVLQRYEVVSYLLLSSFISC